MPPRTLDLDALELASGGHAPTDGEMCLLEAAAYIAGEDWTDRPKCVCPVLGAFGRSLNDRLPHDKRQLLKPLLPELLGTAGDGHQQTRAYMAVDWAVRTYLPEYLRLTDRIPAEAAEQIKNLSPITDEATAHAAGLIVQTIRDQAYKARSDAYTALRERFKTAAAVAYAAAVDAAAAAAYAVDAAAAAAYAAAVDAAAVDAAAAAVAYAAAAYAADDPSALRAAARAAADKALAPTVAKMQDSAIDLYTRMVRLGRDEQTKTDTR